MPKAIILSFLLFVFSSFQNRLTVKDKLIGTWVFENFDYPNYVSPDSKEAKEANRANKGLTITFMQDDKFSSIQHEGMKENNTKTSYKVSKDNKYLTIGTETSKIERLDENYLTLYVEGRPTITFRKKK
ncbi:hypothetical protein [Sediminibacterium sp.]|uniref:hypothetical protein n=1 Tax=Sediminibacterium sp. TaxID=1917865 RepID=UPI0008D259D5|nr:hypothetical protein [Sediminibacterium sp.]MDP3393076.1 hypothetical protein [Sediminibacterium sp.]MDP3567679.1 hypothetical protein [Sediminibacterium sp.]OHC84721.1 MAG: hypothetical protein A2472_10330 [Sphingobacteriia bacterium RIFOXYC2_FULL_35_18]OHC88860.1 MAG: hypothetical protein A2546_06575 [Sphingobacteriia bacterium RIFOXYD2_FULL_35_12]